MGGRGGVSLFLRSPLEAKTCYMCAQYIEFSILASHLDVELAKSLSVVETRNVSVLISFSQQHARVAGLISEEAWPKLWEGDELLRELRAGNLLTGFQVRWASMFAHIKGEAGRLDDLTTFFVTRSYRGLHPNSNTHPSTTR